MVLPLDFGPIEFRIGSDQASSRFRRKLFVRLVLWSLILIYGTILAMFQDRGAAAYLWIDHQRASDLNVYLVGPDGTRVKLFDVEGGTSGSGWQGTVLDDEAAILISANQAKALYEGSYRPEASLTGFDGKLAAGSWTFEITDTKNTKTGTLNRWSLKVRY